MAPITSFHQHFDARQRKIIWHSAHSPLLIIAGAGSGKTRVLAGYLHWLLAGGVAPTQILVASFSNSAVRETLARIASLSKQLGLATVDPVECHTLHAFALRIVRKNARQLGLRPDFTILDSDNAEALFTELISGAKRSPGFPDAKICTAICSLRLNASVKLSALLRTRYPIYAPLRSQLQQLFKDYRAAKRRMNVVDFDDLLVFLLRLLRWKLICKACNAMFDHILIDEFQDLSHLQLQIIKAIRPSGRNVVAFGDDMQSINSFRGASIENFFSFRNAFTQRTRVLKMTLNYRSTGSILEAVNAVSSRSTEAISKRLWTRNGMCERPRLVLAKHETAVAQQIVKETLEMVVLGRRLSSIAVLARTIYDLDAIKKQLIEAGIPIRVVGGSSANQNPMVKAVIDLLNWCENSRDTVAGKRALHALAGLSAANANHIAQRLSGKLTLRHLYEMKRHSHRTQRWKDFIDLFVRIYQLPWKKQVPAIWKWLGAQKVIDGNVPQRIGRALRRAAARSATRVEFLANFALQTDFGSSSRRGTACVTLSTIHAAKGREWNFVYIVNVADGVLPSRLAVHDTQIDEERRILHVAMTRARRRLTLFVPQRSRTVGFGRIETARSRFITRAMLTTFDVRTCPRNTPTIKISTMGEP